MKPRSAERVTRKPTASEAIFLLENGARMDRETFHALYLKTPEGFKAELIGGVVHVASPVSAVHGDNHARLVAWLSWYVMETAGVKAYDNTTHLLDDDSEPQPDASLAIPAELGGQTTIDKDGYIVGAPELVAEVARSSASIDLGDKKAQYERAGVREYVVMLVHEQQVKWFVRRAGQFEELAAAKGGLFKSQVFPGLWLDAASFFATDMSRVVAPVKKGLASPEHAAFVAELEARRKKARPARKPGKKK